MGSGDRGAREAVVVIDLGYGDQGKGTVTDFLVRDRGAHTVVRYNGGAQAGHNVVTPDGRHHTFAQFGAGSFVPGVETFLSAFMAIEPWAMVVEAAHLARAGVADAFARTRIAAGAPVITPFHGAANRLRERARGDGRHGSCGVGVGETVCDARAFDADHVVRAGDLRDPGALRAKLARVQERKRAELASLRPALGGAGARGDLERLDDPRFVEACVASLAPFVAQARVVDDDALGDVLRRQGAVIFEGSQGVLLDEWRGFHPYTTWSTCTGENAAQLLKGYQGEVLRLGVVRAYATRHGAGPLVTEDAALTARVPDAHNVTHAWQGRFRVGWFDAVSTRYAIAACGGVDALAVTCLDRVRDERAWRVATHYDLDGARARDLPLGPHRDLDFQASLTGRVLRARPVYETFHDARPDARVGRIAEETAPVRLVSSGPRPGDKRWLAGR